jgi:hypothetical protein
MPILIYLVIFVGRLKKSSSVRFIVNCVIYIFLLVRPLATASEADFCFAAVSFFFF